MILLLLSRIYNGEKYTIGRLFVNGEYFCDTLELPEKYYGKHNVREKTCIPKGTYPLSVSWSPSFERNLPRLMNVPGRDGILIHRGNTPSDTHGCILVGENKESGKVLNSASTEKGLMLLLEQGEECSITIE